MDDADDDSPVDRFMQFKEQMDEAEIRETEMLADPIVQESIRGVLGPPEEYMARIENQRKKDEALRSLARSRPEQVFKNVQRKLEEIAMSMQGDEIHDDGHNLSYMLEFYNFQFRPDPDKRPEGIDLKQWVLEAADKLGVTSMEEPLGKYEEKKLYEDILYIYCEGYGAENPLDGIIRKAYYDIFSKSSGGQLNYHAYVEIVSAKLKDILRKRNLSLLSIIKDHAATKRSIEKGDLIVSGMDIIGGFGGQMGMAVSDAGKRMLMDRVGLEFERDFKDFLKYMTGLPHFMSNIGFWDLFHDLYRQDIPNGRTFDEFVRFVYEGIRIKDVISWDICDSRYKEDDLFRCLRECKAEVFYKPGFLNNILGLVKENECRDESELIEVASLDIHDYEGISVLGSGAIKTAFLARNRHSGDEVVLLQIHDSSIHPDSKGYKHYKNIYPDISPEEMKKKILDAEFSVTKLGKLKDTTYIAVMSPPIKGEVMGKEHFFIQTSKRYEKTLEDAITGGGMSPEKAIKYFYQICYALGNCHNGGIVHKDLKPDNIGITLGDDLLLSDFGCTSMFSQHSDCRYQYPLKLRPPELAYGDAYWAGQGVILQSDLFTPEANAWTAGAMLYRMLMREDLFKIEGKREEIGTEGYHRQNEEVYQKIRAFSDAGREEMIAEMRMKYGNDYREEYGRLIELCLQTDPAKRRGALRECKSICEKMLP